MNNFKKKNFFVKATTALTALAFLFVLTFSCFGALSIFKNGTQTAYAATDNTFVSTNLNLANGNFDTHSGSFPYTPSSWTTKTIENTNKGSTVAGVVDLDTYNTEDNVRAGKLDIYNEYKTSPPVVPSKRDGDGLPNRKFLMINTNNSSNAYAYSSTGVTIDKNKFYKISAWVKTGMFSDNSGAAIRLDGLDGNYAFNKINTVLELPKNPDNTPDLTSDKADGLLGWRNYTFYVEGSPLTARTMNIVLSVGDYYKSAEETVVDYANGYAFFDNITVHEISASTFNFNTSAGDSKYSKVVRLELESAFENDTIKNAFNFDNNCVDWTEQSHNATDATPQILSANAVGGYDEFGLENAPVSSTGTQNIDPILDNVLLFSTYNQTNESYAKTSIGRRSPALTIERFRYYRLSVWVYSSENSDGATLVVVSDKKLSTEDDDYQKFTISGATGDSSNTARFGWKEYAFYIQGSSIGNYNINLELRLGNKDSRAGGTVLFHNVRFDYVTSSDFNSYSSDGTLVNFDDEFASNNAGVTNGAFMLAGDFEDYEFPLAPASWTYIDAGTAGTANYSSNTAFVNDDNILKGIVPTDIAHFNSMSKTYAPHGIVNKIKDTGNMLVISSLNNTAIGYRSSDITITAATASRLTVNLAVDLINGYGANLVLKNSSNKVIASIEQITSTQNGNIKGDFQPFTFYIEGGSVDSTVSVEIWLGLIDRDANFSKLSSGNVYVNNVSCAALAEGESYSSFEAQYNDARTLGRNISLATYTFNAEKLDAFDYYSSDYVKYPYNWELSALGNSKTDGVRYGIFDYTRVPSSQVEIPSTFKNKDATSNYVLMLNNTAPRATALTYSSNYTLEASQIYRLSISLKTDISYSEGSGNTESSVGAGIILVNTEFKFEDIRSTAEVVDEITDNEAFKTYSFYITPHADTSTVGIRFTLGSGGFSAAYCTGRVYVRSIELTPVNESLYEEVMGELTEEELLEKGIINADLSATEEVEGEVEDGDNKINWWLVPSILFSVTLLLVLIFVAVKKLAENISHKRSKRVVVDSQYDRTRSQRHSDDAPSRIDPEEHDKIYEEFDDILPPAPSRLKSRPAASPVVKKTEPVQSQKDIQYDEEFDDSIPQSEDVEEKAEEATIAQDEPAAEETASTKTNEEEAKESIPTEEATEPAEPSKEKAKPEKAKPQPKTNNISMDEFDD